MYIQPILAGPAEGAAEPGDDDDAEDPSETATVGAAAAAGAEDRRALGDEGSDERESKRGLFGEECIIIASSFLSQSDSQEREDDI